MKNVVLYASKYQHSYQYAKWISEALGWELISLSDVKRSERITFNHVIFGSGVYMGKMNQLKKVLTWFKDKPIIIFATAGNLNDEAQIEVIKDRNFTAEQLSFHRFFYLPGGVDFTQITGFQQKMISFFIRMVEKKPSKTADEAAIVESYYHPTYYVDQSYIEPLVTYAKSLEQSH